MAGLRQFVSMMRSMREVARAVADRRTFCAWHSERERRRNG
jgi:hypothetical protein